MKSPWWRWVIFGLVMSYWLIPLVGAFEFSLRLQREAYSFEAYRIVLTDPRFHTTFLYSARQAITAVVLAFVLVVPAAYAVRLRLPGFRPVLEFISLLPMVIPAIIIVFGYVRLYNSSSFLPMTDSRIGTDVLLTCGYVILALPYVYRSIDTGLMAIDVRTLSEAAQSLGAGPVTTLWHVILPNIRSALLSAAFLTIAIVLGEFTFAALLDRPALAPFIQLVGTSRAYEPAALSIMTFMLTWGFMGLVGLLGRKASR